MREWLDEWYPPSGAAAPRAVDTDEERAESARLREEAKEAIMQQYAAQLFPGAGQGKKAEPDEDAGAVKGGEHVKSEEHVKDEL